MIREADAFSAPKFVKKSDYFVKNIHFFQIMLKLIIYYADIING